MIVTTLGTSSPHARPGDPCSSFLVSSGKSAIWLDTGAGTLGALLRHRRLEDLDAVWVSHTHADHFSDLATTFYALRYADVSRPPLTVFGPLGWADRLRGFLTHDAARPSPLEDVFDIREVTDQQIETTGEFRLIAVAMRHDIVCHGVRIEAGNSTVAYTGDTGPCPGLAQLARGADLLICEAGYGLHTVDDDPMHLTAEQAGETARDGLVASLLLTHLAGADPAACVAAAATAGARSVIGATPGLIIRTP